MYKKLLILMIAIIASNNVVYGAKFDKKQNDGPAYFKLKTALLGAGLSGAFATLFSAPCLLRYAAYTTTATLVGSMSGGAATILSTWIPITEKNQNWLLANNHIVPSHANQEQRKRAPYEYAMLRGLFIAAITGSLVGSLATVLCYTGHTFDDLKRLISG